MKKKIAGIEVKDIFNRKGVEKVICHDKVDEDPHNNALLSEAIVKPLDDHNRPLKKRKLDASEIFVGDELKNDEGKSIDAVEHQAPLQSGSASENKLSKNLNESPKGERDLFLKPEEKLMELSHGKLDEVSCHQSPQKDDKNNYEALQAPLPIDVDKNTWLKKLSVSLNRDSIKIQFVQLAYGSLESLKVKEGLQSL